MTQNALNNTASIFDVDNLRLDGNTIISTDTNGDVVIAPDGTGDVVTGTTGTATVVSMLRSGEGQWLGMDDQTDVFGLFNSTGTPEGGITANIGSLCTDTTNGELFIKQTDSANTGWISIGGTTGVVIASAQASITARVSTATTIPLDDTLPQITEGAQVITLAYTATSATTTLIVEAWGFGQSTPNPLGALFQQGTNDAFAAAFLWGAATVGSFYIAGTTTAGSTDSETYEFRFGPQTATTIYIGGYSVGELWGAAGATYLRVTELST